MNSIFTEIRNDRIIKQVGKIRSRNPDPAYFFDVSEIHELCRLLEDRRTAAEEMLVAVFT